jgi:hypothetical protein
VHHYIQWVGLPSGMQAGDVPVRIRSAWPFRRPPRPGRPRSPASGSGPCDLRTRERPVTHGLRPYLPALLPFDIRQIRPMENAGRAFRQSDVRAPSASDPARSPLGDDVLRKGEVHDRRLLRRISAADGPGSRGKRGAGPERFASHQCSR